MVLCRRLCDVEKRMAKTNQAAATSPSRRLLLAGFPAVRRQSSHHKPAHYRAVRAFALGGAGMPILRAKQVSSCGTPHGGASNLPKVVYMEVHYTDTEKRERSGRWRNGSVKRYVMKWEGQLFLRFLKRTLHMYG